MSDLFPLLVETLQPAHPNLVLTACHLLSNLQLFSFQFSHDSDMFDDVTKMSTASVASESLA